MLSSKKLSHKSVVFSSFAVFFPGIPPSMQLEYSKFLFPLDQSVMCFLPWEYGNFQEVFPGSVSVLCRRVSILNFAASKFLNNWKRGGK